MQNPVPCAYCGKLVSIGTGGWFVVHSAGGSSLLPSQRRVALHYSCKQMFQAENLTIVVGDEESAA
jgi:hypothetical protein